MGFERVEDVSVAREVVPIDRRSCRVAHSRPAMGTRASVSALVRSQDRADDAIGRAFEEMDRLVGIFSHYDDRSAASQLNLLGRLDGPPPELAQVVFDAIGYHRLTRGGFDISVAPVLELFRARWDGTLPAGPCPMTPRCVPPSSWWGRGISTSPVVGSASVGKGCA
jgi:thiamine biosynthesis lipoprotein